jgi:hypothetical protein
MKKAIGLVVLLLVAACSGGEDANESVFSAVLWTEGGAPVHDVICTGACKPELPVILDTELPRRFDNVTPELRMSLTVADVYEVALIDACSYRRSGPVTACSTEVANTQPAASFIGVCFNGFCCPGTWQDGHCRVSFIARAK